MEIDVSGTVCPQTVLIVKRCLAELEPEDALTVVGDYPPAERSIRRSCHKHRYDVSAASTTDPETEFALRIRVTEESEAKQPDTETA